MNISRASSKIDHDRHALPQAGRWPDRLAPLLIIGLVLVFFAKMAFTNLILARGDTFLYFYPYWQMASDALRAGHIPFWNDHIFMGVPFVANSQAGFFYPLNWPVWLLLDVPYAVSASILVHVMIAGLGVYLLGRRAVRLSPVAALLAAMLFSLGGYLTAQVEHINQVQGLAWLPWLLFATQPVAGSAAEPSSKRTWLVSGALLGGILALQLLAGHTQSAFISGVAVSLWLLVHLIYGRANRRYVAQIAGLLLVAVLVAGGLAAVQLLPTLELTRYSARQGGLSMAEVLSFSWNPLQATRSLLPGYGQSLFSEYVAFLPLTALVLGTVGAWRWRGRPAITGLLVLISAGLVLALGRFTPLYWLLSNLPGFDLFRVPARWLVLYALGTALLAGVGWDALARTHSPADRARLKRPLIIGLLLVGTLMVWGYAAELLTGLIPTGPEALFERPTPLTLLGWLVELTLAGVLLVIVWRSAGRPRVAPMTGLIILSGVVLWLASRGLPYNNLTTPEAYFDVRPPAARLQALAGCEVPEEPCRRPPDRFLSLSDILFDLGDQAEIDTIYVDQLAEAARYDYTVAIKQKEIIAPNLPMVYGLYAVDGFDGGILPLAAYSDLMGLILPEGEVTADGRLREYLTAVPATRWLDLFNTRYLITDKVGDAWRQGVFFDRQFPMVLAAGEDAAVGYVPSFVADEVWLLAAGDPPSVAIESGDNTFTLVAELLEAPDLYRVRLPNAVAPESMALKCEASGGCASEAVTLVDSRNATFQTVVAGPFQQIFSGDVKIYEYLDASPRAWLVHEWQWQTDIKSSVAAMRSPDFDPQVKAVLVGEGRAVAPAAGKVGTGVTVSSHSAEQVMIKVTTAQPGLVVLADANYPGWRAELDGQPVPILQTDGLFRGVFVPAGDHQLFFYYQPDTFRAGLLLSVATMVLGLFGLFSLLRQKAA